MHYATYFRGGQCERGLLDYFQGKRERHWPITAHTVFQRFAFDQFHGIETFVILLPVISHPSNIWMVNVRCRARFAQKPGSRAGILRHAAVDNFQRDSRVQHGVTGTVGYGHRSRTKLDRKTILPYLRFEVGVPQWSGRQSAVRPWSFGLFAVCQKTEANETTQALAIRTALRQLSPTSGARPHCSSVRVRIFRTNAVVIHTKTQFTPSVSDRGGVVRHRRLPDRRRCWLLPLSTIHGNAGAGVKATSAVSRLALQAGLRLSPDSAPGCFHPQRTV